MGTTKTTKKPNTRTGDGTKYEDMFQVVLFNDEHVFAGLVVDSLIRVLGHDRTMAVRIMMEAHNRGKAIAQVEDETSAQQHCTQLRANGLTVQCEKVE